MIFKPVERALVHKARDGEVLIANLTRVGNARYTALVPAPTHHELFGDNPRPCLDPVFLVEAFRQTGYAVAHQFENVPLDFQFILKELQLARAPSNNSARTDSIGTDDPALLTFDISESRFRDGALSGFSAVSDYRIGGETSQSLAAAVSFYAPPIYQRIRWSKEDFQQGRVVLTSSASSVRACDVGRGKPSNVLIDNIAHREEGHSFAEAMLPENHPYFLDHPIDHLPGVFHFEATHQMALAMALYWRGLTPSQVNIKWMKGDFDRFANVDQPLKLDAQISQQGDTDMAVNCLLSQANEVARIGLQLFIAG